MHTSVSSSRESVRLPDTALALKGAHDRIMARYDAVVAELATAPSWTKRVELNARCLSLLDAARDVRSMMEAAA